MNYPVNAKAPETGTLLSKGRSKGRGLLFHFTRLESEEVPVMTTKHKKLKAITAERAQEFSHLDGATHVGFKQAVMMHGVAMLPRLRELEWGTRMQVMKEAQRITLQDAVWIDVHGDPAKIKKYKVPSWLNESISAAQVIALMVFGLWVSVGEREDLAAGLLADWPDIPAYVKLYAEGS